MTAGGGQVRIRLTAGGDGIRTLGPSGQDVPTNRRSSLVRCAAVRSAAVILPGFCEPGGQQGKDFLLNLRIVEQAQKRLLESLVLLGPLDLVFSFGSILHRAIMP